MLINDKDFLFSSPVVVKQMKTYLQERGLSKGSRKLSFW